MVTLVMRPAFTSSRNCEYSIGACVAWRVLNWLNTVISTSPITSQMTRFLSMLFKDLLLFGAAPQRSQSTLFQIDCGAARGFNPLASKYVSRDSPREAEGFRVATVLNVVLSAPSTSSKASP